MRKRREREAGRKRTVRAAEDPGVQGRLAMEPVRVRDVELAAHAQPPRPGLFLPAPLAAASMARAPHGPVLSARLTALAALVVASVSCNSMIVSALLRRQAPRDPAHRLAGFYQAVARVRVAKNRKARVATGSAWPPSLRRIGRRQVWHGRPGGKCRVFCPIPKHPARLPGTRTPSIQAFPCFPVPTWPPSLPTAVRHGLPFSVPGRRMRRTHGVRVTGEHAIVVNCLLLDRREHETELETAKQRKRMSASPPTQSPSWEGRLEGHLARRPRGRGRRRRQVVRRGRR